MFRVGDVIHMMAEVEGGGKPFRKPKYHVCACSRNRLYFFINSSGHFKDSFQLTNSAFPVLPNPVSYIGCGAVLQIPDSHFQRRKYEVVGQLPRDVLLALLDHVNEAEALEEDDKELIVGAITEALGY